jgi:hypothetical protein
MSALALAADAAAAPDWVARWLGIAGLVVSIGTVAVTVSLWRRDGWKLAVTCWPAERGRSDGYLATVTNVGRMPCIVASVAVRYHEERFLRRRPHAYLELRSEVDGPELPRTLAPTETMRVLFFPDTRLSRQGPRPPGRTRRVQAVVITGRRQFRSSWRPEL